MIAVFLVKMNPLRVKKSLAYYSSGFATKIDVEYTPVMLQYLIQVHRKFTEKILKYPTTKNRSQVVGIRPLGYWSTELFVRVSPSPLH